MNEDMNTLKVSEIFYSLQGEGLRAGEPSLFVRLQGCSAKHACYASGVKCDTEFESGKEMLITDIGKKLIELSPNCEWIVFTGGEPLDQLTAEILHYFLLGWRVQIETSGVKPVPKHETGDRQINLLTISPKVAEHVLAKNFPEYTEQARSITLPPLELKYVRHTGQEIPNPSLRADHYFLSPHFDGLQFPSDNVRHCIELIKNNPQQWKLSMQQHKILGIL